MRFLAVFLGALSQIVYRVRAPLSSTNFLELIFHFGKIHSLVKFINKLRLSSYVNGLFTDSMKKS